MRRIIHSGASEGALLELDAPDLHHLRDVVRLTVGQQVEVMDGRGGVFSAVWLGAVGPQIRIQARAAIFVDDDITIALAVIRGPKMDWAVEKLSELGVRRLVPLRTERSRPVPRTDRWLRIAEAAAKQCGRSRVLSIAPETSLHELDPSGWPGRSRFWLDQRGEPISAAELSLVEPVIAVIGPEGGLTETERERLLRSDFRPLRAANMVLRSETAALAAAALLVGLRQRL